MFLVLERKKPLLTVYQALLLPPCTVLNMNTNPKLDRPAMPSYMTGQGFSQQSITQSITMKPQGQNEFVLSPSAIKSLSWQDSSRTESPINKLLWRQFDFCLVCLKEASINSKKPNTTTTLTRNSSQYVHKLPGAGGQFSAICILDKLHDTLDKLPRATHIFVFLPPSRVLKVFRIPPCSAEKVARHFTSEKFQCYCHFGSALTL